MNSSIIVLLFSAIWSKLKVENASFLMCIGKKMGNKKNAMGMPIAMVR